MTITEEMEMSKTYYEKSVETREEFDQLFQLNPKNVRDWAIYDLKAEVKDGVLSFVPTNKKLVTDDVKSFIDSLYKRNQDGVYQIGTVNNAIIVSPKQSDGKHIITAGNTRSVIRLNMIEALRDDLTKEESDSISWKICPVQYKIDNKFKEKDLISYQLHDNTGVRLTYQQRLKLIMLSVEAVKEELVEKNPEIDFNKRETAAIIRDTVISDCQIRLTAYFDALKLDEMRKSEDGSFIFHKLEKGVINSADLAIDIYRFSNRKDVIAAKYDCTILWDALMDATRRSNLEIPSDGIWTKVKTKILAELVDSNTSSNGDSPVAAVENTENGLTTESSDDQPLTESSESQSKPSEEKITPKLKRSAELREVLKSGRDNLNELCLKTIADATNFLLKCDPSLYDNDDAIGLILLQEEMISRLNKFRTINQKEIDEASKKAAKETKMAAREERKKTKAAEKAKELQKSQKGE